MIKQMLEKKVGQISDEAFEEIMHMADADIKFNRIGFKKSTNLNYVLDIAVSSAKVFKSC